MSNLALYAYFCDCGRMGDLDGLFIAPVGITDRVLGERIYWGEVLGKHSEIIDKLDEYSFTLKTDDQEFLQKLIEVLALTPVRGTQFYGVSGFNPIEMLYEQDKIDQQGNLTEEASGYVYPEVVDDSPH